MHYPYLSGSPDIQPIMFLQRGSLNSCATQSMLEITSKQNYNTNPSNLATGSTDCQSCTGRSMSDFGLSCHRSILEMQHVNPAQLLRAAKRSHNCKQHAAVQQRRVRFADEVSITMVDAAAEYDRRNPEYKSTDGHLKMYKALMNYKIREMESHSESVCNINRHLVRASPDQLKLRTEILDNVIRDWHQDQLQRKRINWGQYIACKSKEYVDCTC